MRDMHYTSQPLERSNMKLLEGTMEAMGAETQPSLFVGLAALGLWDPPAAITTLPFLSERAKRNILGLQRGASVRARHGAAQAGRERCAGGASGGGVMRADAEMPELSAALGAIERLTTAAIARGQASAVPEPLSRELSRRLRASVSRGPSRNRAFRSHTTR